MKSHKYFGPLLVAVMLASLFPAGLASAAPPAVTTGTAVNVTARSAVLTGNLTSLGTATSVAVSFDYGTTTSYGGSTPPVVYRSPGSFAFYLTGLSPATTYHFRAKADGGAAGVVTGSDATFTT
ncbi:MAG: hypothetical protein N3E40_03340, partial [Dehalococcoidia bacterium]|nr:hypothetical protein [Dehalococcoidia bacterium]